MPQTDRYHPDNFVKIYRSLNAGQNWDFVHSIPLAQTDQSWFYNKHVEAAVANFHIAGENGDNVCAFFTRTQMRIAGRTLRPRVRLVCHSLPRRRGHVVRAHPSHEHTRAVPLAAERPWIRQGSGTGRP